MSADTYLDKLIAMGAPSRQYQSGDPLRVLVAESQLAALVDAEVAAAIGRPIDMILHCPECHTQHIDAPEHLAGDYMKEMPPKWTNPPHRSHLCHRCGHIWRPADVPTNGVAAIKTRGKHDTTNKEGGA